MKKEEEIWLAFCKKFRTKLKDITDPVALNKNNRSYDALNDVVTNVILLEINLDKKPWEEIPKKDVRLPTREDMKNDAVWMDSNKTIADVLLKKIAADCSWHYTSAESLSPHTVASLGLFSALKTYLKDYQQWN